MTWLAALEGAGIGPVVLMMRAIEGLHISAGLPWWGAIVGMTVAVRVVLMPLYFNGVRVMGGSGPRACSSNCCVCMPVRS